MRQIRRYTIPADGKPHTFELCYDPQHAGPGVMRDELFFWAEWFDGTDDVETTLMVIRNGDEMPDDALWLFTVPASQAGEAWHLLKLPGEERDLVPIVLDITPAQPGPDWEWPEG